MDCSNGCTVQEGSTARVGRDSTVSSTLRKFTWKGECQKSLPFVLKLARSIVGVYRNQYLEYRWFCCVVNSSITRNSFQLSFRSNRLALHSYRSQLFGYHLRQPLQDSSSQLRANKIENEATLSISKNQLFLLDQFSSYQLDSARIHLDPARYIWLALPPSLLLLSLRNSKTWRNQNHLSFSLNSWSITLVSTVSHQSHSNELPSQLSAPSLLIQFRHFSSREWLSFIVLYSVHLALVECNQLSAALGRLHLTKVKK